MERKLLGELTISNSRQTLSARVFKLVDLAYNRYSIFFDQAIVDIGPSHMIISKRVIFEEYRWTCEEKSTIQDDDLANSVGEEIDRLLTIPL